MLGFDVAIGLGYGYQFLHTLQQAVARGNKLQEYGDVRIIGFQFGKVNRIQGKDQLRTKCNNLLTTSRWPDKLVRRTAVSGSPVHQLIQNNRFRSSCCWIQNVGQEVSLELLISNCIRCVIKNIFHHFLFPLSSNQSVNTHGDPFYLNAITISWITLWSEPSEVNIDCFCFSLDIFMKFFTWPSNSITESLTWEISSLIWDGDWISLATWNFTVFEGLGLIGEAILKCYFFCFNATSVNSDESLILLSSFNCSISSASSEGGFSLSLSSSAVWVLLQPIG